MMIGEVEHVELKVRHYFEKNKNSKKIWNGIKEIINIKQKSFFLPTSLKDKENFLTNQKEIAGHFNCYFSGITEKNIRASSTTKNI